MTPIRPFRLFDFSQTHASGLFRSSESYLFVGRTFLRMSQNVAAARQARDLTAGLILVFTAIVSLIVLAHHPVIKARETDELFTPDGEDCFRRSSRARCAYSLSYSATVCILPFRSTAKYSTDPCPPRFRFLLTWNGGDDWRSAG